MCMWELPIANVESPTLSASESTAPCPVRTNVRELSLSRVR